MIDRKTPLLDELMERRRKAMEEGTYERQQNIPIDTPKADGGMETPLLDDLMERRRNAIKNGSYTGQPQIHNKETEGKAWDPFDFAGNAKDTAWNPEVTWQEFRDIQKNRVDDKRRGTNYLKDTVWNPEFTWQEFRDAKEKVEMDWQEHVTDYQSYLDNIQNTTEMKRQNIASSTEDAIEKQQELVDELGDKITAMTANGRKAVTDNQYIHYEYEAAKGKLYRMQKEMEKDASGETELEIGKRDDWLSVQSGNLNILSDKYAREAVEKYVEAKDVYDNEVKGSAMGGLGPSYETSKVYLEAEKKLKDMGYDERQIDSLADTYIRVGNASSNRKMQQELDESMNSGNEALKDTAHSLGSIGTNLFSGMGILPAIDAKLSEWATGGYVPIDTNSPYYYAGNYRDQVRQETAQDIEESVDNKIAKKVLPWIYQAGMSTADTLTAGAVGGEALALGTMSAGAASSSAKDTFERTGDTGKSLGTGVAAGMIEFASEKVSLDYLWGIMKKSGKAATRSTLVNLLVSSGIEGSEEVASDVANRIVDDMVNGGMSEYEQGVQAYISSGMPEDAARAQANKDFLYGVGESFIVGSMSGAMGGGAGEVVSALNKSNAGMDLKNSGEINDIAERAQGYDDYNVQKALHHYQRYQGGYQAAKLYQEVLNFEQKEGISADATKETRGEQQRPEKQVEQGPEKTGTEQNGQTQQGLAETDMEQLVSAEEYLGRMSRAQTAEELVEAERGVERTGNEQQKENARMKYEYMSGKLLNEGKVTGEELQQAKMMLTEEEAYEAGARDEKVPEERLNIKGRIAYNEGNMKYKEEEGRRRFQKKTRESRLVEEELSQIRNAKAGGADGNTFIVKGIHEVGEEPVLETVKGTVKASEAAFESVAMQKLYNQAVSQETVQAANAYLDSYPAGMNLDDYAGYYNRFLNAGKLGVSFQNVMKSSGLLSKYIDEESLQKIYDAGKAIYDAQAAQEQPKKTVKRKGTGRVIDQRESKEPSALMPVYEAVAKKLGVDIVLNDELEAGARGSLQESIGKVMLNAESGSEFGALIHETMGEYAESWNSEGMQQFQTDLIEWFMENHEREAENLITSYQKVYVEVEGEKSYREAANELMNDAIEGLFRTEDGIQEFTEWLYENRGQNEAKTVLQSLADFIQKLVESIRRALGKSEMSTAAKKMASMEADKAAEMRRKLLAVVDGAVKNYREVQEDADAADPGSKHSIEIYSQEEIEEHDKKALEYFGRTSRWSETGYLTLGGKRIDFSGRHEGGPGGYRTVDHRDITDAIGYDYGDGSYSGGMIQFMSEGNIRISPECNGINLSVMPTRDQMDALRDFIQRNRGEVILEIDDLNGNTVFGKEYDRGMSSEQILDDIEKYFAEGEKKYQSPLSQFRYSLNVENDLGLDKHTKAQMEQWSRNPKIQVYESKEQFMKFIDRAMDMDNVPGTKMYFGKIKADMAKRIADSTGMETEGYNLTLRSDEVRKILKNSHGNIKTESLRGQRVITKEDLYHIPEIIREPDSISLGEKLYEGKPVICFRKQLNGRETVITYISNKHKDLTVQTMYSGKNKKSLATTPGDESILPQTSETLSGTASKEDSHQASYDNSHDRTSGTDLDMSPFTNSISQREENTTEKIKKSLSLSDTLNMDDFWRSSETFKDLMGNTDNVLEKGTKIMHGKEVNKDVIDKIADKLLREYSSNYDQSTLIENLEKVFSYMHEQPRVKSKDMVKVMAEIAKPVLEESGKYNQAEVEQYENFRKYLREKRIRLSEEQKAYVAEMYGSYEAFRKKYFGRVVFTEKGESLDSIWGELASHAGGYMEMDTEYASEPLVLVDALEVMNPQLQNKFGADNNGLAVDLAMQIFEDYFNGFDGIEPKALKQELIHEQATFREKVRKEYNERLKKIKKSTMTGRINARIEARVAEVKAANTRSQLAAHRRMMAVKYRDSIKKNGGQLIRWIERPTDKNHVPEAMKKDVLQFLGAIDFISSRAKEDSMETKRWQERMREVQDHLRMADDGNFAKMYDEIYNNFRLEMDPDFVPTMEEFLKANDSAAKVSDLEYEQLKKLNDLMTMLKRAVTKANELHQNKSYKRVQDAAMETIGEIQKKKDRKKYGEGVEKARNLLNVSMLDSFTYFDMLGEGAKSIHKELRDGFNIRTWHIKEAQDFMKEILKKKDRKSIQEWTGDKAVVHEFKAGGGRLRLTTGQIMSIYLLSKRNQARRHMLIGGIRATEVGKGKNRINQVKPLHVNEKILNQIIEVLSPEQKEIADKMQRFLAENVAEWGNNASMTLYGYKKFMDDRYFPIKTYGNSIRTNDKNSENGSLYAIRNIGATKSLIPEAKNALDVGDILDVFTDHVVQMANYDAFAAPLTDAMKWFNFKNEEMVDEFLEAESVKEEIERAYGSKAKGYFVQLIKDINGEASNATDTDISSKFISNYKAAAVGANLRVAIQQPTAYMRAALLLSPRDMLAAFTVKPQVKKAKDNSAIALWKTWGYYETSMGQSMKQVITGQSSIGERIRDKTSIAAQIMDNITWGWIWNACENEVKRKNPGLEEAELNVKIAERFDEVIDQTQVVDTILHRTQYMRSKDLLIKIEAAFMSEPHKSYNMLYRSLISGEKKIDKKFAKTLVVYAFTAALTSLMAAFSDAFRDDDMDKGFWKKYLDAAVSNMKDNVNPFGMIPYVKDAISIWEGYDVDRMDMAAVANLFESVQRAGKFIRNSIRGEENNKTTFGVVKSLLRGISQVTGIPLYNLEREVEAIVETFSGKQWREDVMTQGALYKKLVQYAEEGNTEKYDEVYQELLDLGVYAFEIKDSEKKKVKADVKKQYLEENTMDYAEAERILEKYGYSVKDIRDEEKEKEKRKKKADIKREYLVGNMSERTAISKLKILGEEEDDAYWILKKWEGELQEGDYDKWDDFKNAVETGSNLKSVIREYTSNGVKKETLAGQITKQYKKEFIQLYRTNKTKAAALKARLLTAYQALGYDRDKKSKDIDEWLEQKK